MAIVAGSCLWGHNAGSWACFVLGFANSRVLLRCLGFAAEKDFAKSRYLLFYVFMDIQQFLFLPLPVHSHIPCPLVPTFAHLHDCIKAGLAAGKYAM